MNETSMAILLGDLIEADENERVRLEILLDRYGITGLFQRLDEDIPLSTQSLEKLRAVQIMIEQIPARNVTEMEEEIKYELPPHE